MDILFGLACLALAAVVLFAARLWFSSRPADSTSADLISMLAATANTGLIALGVSELVHFVFGGTGTWRWIDGGIAIVATIAVIAAAIFIMKRLRKRALLPNA